MKTKYFSRIGSISYILWGLLNIFAGLLLLSYSAAGNMKDFLYNMSPMIDSNHHIPLAGNKAVLGLAGFHAFNLLWVGLLSIGTAVLLNWKNDKTGFWINLTLGLFINMGFLFFLYVPGNMPIANGILVLFLFLIGLVFTALALRSKSQLIET